MLFKQTPKITFVIYQNQKTVRAFEFDKRKLKFIFLLISVLLLVSFFTIFFLLAYVKNKGQNLSEGHLTYGHQQASKIQELEDKLAQISKLNEQYQKKIPQSPNEVESIFPLFSTPLGSRNLTQKKWLEAKAIDIKFHSKKIFLYFNIINARQNGTKLLGYIFVVMIQGPQISFYPDPKISFDQTTPSFNQGETFTISRFRRVEGHFYQVPQNNLPVTFKIFIFSKTGDMIHHQIVGPVKVPSS